MPLPRRGGQGISFVHFKWPTRSAETRLCDPILAPFSMHWELSLERQVTRIFSRTPRWTPPSSTPRCPPWPRAWARARCACSRWLWRIRWPWMRMRKAGTWMPEGRLRPYFDVWNRHTCWKWSRPPKKTTKGRGQAARPPRINSVTISSSMHTADRDAKAVSSIVPSAY